MRRLEEPPLDDSLAAINWMQRALVAMACDVKNSKIAEAEKIDHMQGGATELDPRIREAIEQNLELDAELGALIGLSEMFLSGGRRSGKTVIMEGILNSYAVAVPDAIVWTVVPSENFLGEPKRVNDKMLPSDWYEYLGDPNHTYYLANGSEHVIRSGFTAGSLKQGEAVLVGINEAQQVPADSYRNTLGATIDGGGFTIVAANPPTHR